MCLLPCAMKECRSKSSQSHGVAGGVQRDGRGCQALLKDKFVAASWRKCRLTAASVSMSEQSEQAISTVAQ